MQVHHISWASFTYNNNVIAVMSVRYHSVLPCSNSYCLKVSDELLFTPDCRNLIFIASPADSSISMKVYPSTLSGSGGWVRVTWSYVSDPSGDDWVGLYSPPTNDGYRINPSEHAPIKLLVIIYPHSIL